MHPKPGRRPRVERCAVFIKLPPELVEVVDQARGPDVPRGDFIWALLAAHFQRPDLDPVVMDAAVGASPTKKLKTTTQTSAQLRLGEAVAAGGAPAAAAQEPTRAA
jgi:hypothetical protein